jgi:hypothetical protein
MERPLVGIATQLDEIASRANISALRVMMDKYHLSRHFRSLRRYLLLGQGDFVHTLIEMLNEELNRPARFVYRHNLLSILESAIRSSGQEAQDTERLDIRIVNTTTITTTTTTTTTPLPPPPSLPLTSSSSSSSNDLKSGELTFPTTPHHHIDTSSSTTSFSSSSPSSSPSTMLGWDVVTLDYIVQWPETLILTPSHISRYVSLFHGLWALKRAEYGLNTVWALHRERTSAKNIHNKYVLLFVLLLIFFFAIPFSFFWLHFLFILT